jgi:FixJ family two-component response regulator
MHAAYTDFSQATPANFSRPPLPAIHHLQETVYLLDQDYRVRKDLTELLAELEIKVIGLTSATDYRQLVRRDSAACLILDMHLPDIRSLVLQPKLSEGLQPPVIFISGECDIRSTVWAMKAGAMEVLSKPVDPSALIPAVRAAFTQDRRLRQKKAELARLQQRLALLTPREREVFPLIVGGLLNKQAAFLLGISEVTLQIHRGQVMRKMEAESFADLVRMAVKLRIPHWREQSQDGVAAVAHA